MYVENSPFGYCAKFYTYSTNKKNASVLAGKLTATTSFYWSCQYLGNHLMSL